MPIPRPTLRVAATVCVARLRVFTLVLLKQSKPLSDWPPYATVLRLPLTCFSLAVCFWRPYSPSGVDLAGGWCAAKAKVVLLFCNYIKHPYKSYAAGLACSGRCSLNDHLRNTIARNKSRTLASLRLLTLTYKTFTNK
eukprot:1399880-Pleurochrysis_carterae.AAC.1